MNKKNQRTKTNHQNKTKYSTDFIIYTKKTSSKEISVPQVVLSSSLDMRRTIGGRLLREQLPLRQTNKLVAADSRFPRQFADTDLFNLTEVACKSGIIVISPKRVIMKLKKKKISTRYPKLVANVRIILPPIPRCLQTLCKQIKNCIYMVNGL